jgi:hypothetical protein
MEEMTNFERLLNSRTAYYVSYLVEENTLISQRIKSDIKKIIADSGVRNLPKYQSKETWKYITKMEFGKLKRLLFYLAKNQELKKYLKLITADTGVNINKLKNQINELHNLRNHLFHFTPLNIYISHGLAGRKGERLTNTRRKKAVDFIFNRKRNEEIKEYLLEFYNVSDKFIAIKNSRHIAG